MKPQKNEVTLIIFRVFLLSPATFAQQREIKWLPVLSQGKILCSLSLKKVFIDFYAIGVLIVKKWMKPSV